jgi:hypothetical protein
MSIGWSKIGQTDSRISWEIGEIEKEGGGGIVNKLRKFFTLFLQYFKDV